LGSPPRSTDECLALPNTAQAITIDVGNPDDVHPTNKVPVGHRLALIAKARDYAVACESSGPSSRVLSPKARPCAFFLDHAEA